jgi:outer membrane protein OmpA-like peptidoglycan-associated protein
MKRMITSAVVLTGLVMATDALAQERSEGRSWFQDKVTAPENALELTVGTGYTQGFGMLQGGVSMPDVVKQGVGVDLGVGYRFSPHWSGAVVGQYQELYAENARGARGMTGGIAATYHFDPMTRLDPWVELGTGYRFLWEDKQLPATNVLSHGFELAKARIGVDVRVTPELAVAPVIGADLNVFIRKDDGTSTTIDDPRVSSFVFGGLMGRFDVGTKTESPPPAVAKARELGWDDYLSSTTEITSAPIVAKPVPVSPSLNVAEEILNACNLHFNDIQSAPKFEFDKSELQPADEDVLAKIADCVTTGPLAGRELKLVGRADPRGTQKYNMALGARRANAISTFLNKQGVDRSSIHETSRGELDAVGKDETGWAVDRRVDILLQ